MDSAATDWHWFWFGLLVIAIVTEIALRAIAATTRHLLVCLTSLGHHNINNIMLLFTNNTFFFIYLYMIL